MSSPLAFALIWLLALGGCWLSLRLPVGPVRQWLFATINLAGVLGAYYLCGGARLPMVDGVAWFVGYLAIVLVFYIALVWARKDVDRRALVPILLPVLSLVVFKLFIAGTGVTGWWLVGFSFMTFRLSYLAVEVRNGTARHPTLPEYLGFALFLPTLAVGPINAFANFQLSLANPRIDSALVGRAVMRIVVGVVKFRILGHLANQLSFSGLWQDGNDHTILDFLVSCISYYIYLYANFSGFCDISVGTSALLGIKVSENFDHPFAARNIKDFWNRWHITLSAYMREMMFTPLSKYLVSVMGPGRVNHCIALAILFTFILIGLWHGVGWNFFLFGLYHGVGVTIVHYYTIWLKQHLGRGILNYQKNAAIRSVGVAVTFFYVSFGFFLFENSASDMAAVIAAFPGSITGGRFRLW